MMLSSRSTVLWLSTSKEISISVREQVLHIVIIVYIPLGGNPSAEEQEEALEEGAVTVNNVVHSFRLQPTTFDKKTYLGYLKVNMVSHM